MTTRATAAMFHGPPHRRKACRENFFNGARSMPPHRARPHFSLSPSSLLRLRATLISERRSPGPHSGSHGKICQELLKDPHALLVGAKTFDFQVALLDTLSILGRAAATTRETVLSPYMEGGKLQQGSQFMQQATALLDRLNAKNGAPPPAPVPSTSRSRTPPYHPSHITRPACSCFARCARSA